MGRMLPPAGAWPLIATAMGRGEEYTLNIFEIKKNNHIGFAFPFWICTTCLACILKKHFLHPLPQIPDFLTLVGINDL
jgi:hypothetical protein